MPRIGDNLSLEPSLDEEDYEYDVDQGKDDFIDEDDAEEILVEKRRDNGDLELKYEKEQRF